MSAKSFALPFLALVPALLSPCLAAQPSSSDRGVDEDIEFAVGLAKDFQFVDMALEVLGGLSDAELDAAQRRAIARARADVYGEAAKNELDETVKEGRFTEALDQYKAFIEANPGTTEANDAKRDFIALASEYGAYMEGLLEEASGDEAARIREDLETRLNRVSFFATESIVDLKSNFNALSKLEQNDLFKLMLAQGNLLLILGRISEGGESYLSNAASTMEELVFMAGTDTGFGLNGYHVLGRVEEARGNFQGAVDFYEYVATQVIPDKDEEWELRKQDTPQATIDTLWAYYEREISWLVDAELAANHGDKAVGRGLRFYNLFRREGFTLSPFGHQSMLAVARALLEVGGFVGGSAAAGDMQWFATAEALNEAGVAKRNQTSAAQLALEIANHVNTENRGNTLQIRAQRLISEVVDSGLQVTPDVLFEAALGSLNGEDFDAAIAGLRKVISSLATEADRKLFMPKVQCNLGHAFRRSERSLEAALAYREGVDAWRGDEEWDPQNASGYYAMMSRLRREMKDVPEIESMFRESEVLQSSIGEGAGGAIDWRRAQRAYDAKEYEEAREICQTIGDDSDYREKAIVRAAACAYQLGELDTAEQELNEYLGPYLDDPRHRLQSTEVQLLKLRNEAKAEAVYTLGQIERERGNWEGLLARYENFAEDFRGQDSLIVTTLIYRIEAAIESGQEDLADRLLERMIDEFPKDPNTGKAASKLYNWYLARFNELEAGSPEAKRIKGKMAESLALSNRLSDSPSFNALSTEASFWADAENWTKAEAVLDTIRKQFVDSTDAEIVESMQRSILPRYGKALLELKRVAESYEVLAPLVPNFDATDTELKPSVETIETYSRSVTGWLEGLAESPTLVPGVGGAQPLENAAGWMAKVAKTSEKYSCDYFKATFIQAFALYQLGVVDTSKQDWVNGVMDTLNVEYGPTFRELAEICGQEAIQNHYRWLMDKVK